MTTNTPPSCQHMNFQASANIGRLSVIDGGPITHYSAEFKVQCADCGQPLEFVGLPLGSSAYRPTVSIDGLEIRAPMVLPGTVPPEGLPGFSVRIGETEQ